MKRDQEERLSLNVCKVLSSWRYEDLPPNVVQRAKDCIIDAVATISYGAELPWSKMIIAQARRTSAAVVKLAPLVGSLPEAADYLSLFDTDIGRLAGALAATSN